MIGRVFSCLFWIAAVTVSGAVQGQALNGTPIPNLTYEIIDQQSHHNGLFTQGMLIHDGWVYESSGRYGQSRLARYKESDSSRLVIQPLSKQIFAEGLTRFNDHFFLLTWRAGKAFKLDQFWQTQEVFDYQGEGWGLTHDGTSLIMSDGSDTLQFRDPLTFEVRSRLKVTGANGNWDQLNELEYVGGIIWANRWQTSEIIAINSHTGAVLGVLDVSDLSKQHQSGRYSADQVANGIAWSEARQGFWVTGKYWNKRYLLKVGTDLKVPLPATP